MLFGKNLYCSRGFGISTLKSGYYSFGESPDQECSGNAPQRVCNKEKQFNTPKKCPGHGCIVAHCCHECEKKYHNQDCKVYPDSCQAPFPVFPDHGKKFQDISLPVLVWHPGFFSIPASRFLPDAFEIMGVEWLGSPVLTHCQ